MSPEYPAVKAIKYTLFNFENEFSLLLHHLKKKEVLGYVMTTIQNKLHASMNYREKKKTGNNFFEDPCLITYLVPRPRLKLMLFMEK